MDTGSSLLVAQITDTHLFAEVEPKVFGVQSDRLRLKIPHSCVS
jgi:hypothetical protein